jgi:hypothetical protein
MAKLSPFGDEPLVAPKKVPTTKVSPFGDTAMPARPAQPPGWGDTAIDAAKAIPRGLRLGYEGLAGLGGDVYDLEISGAGKVAKWLGASPEKLAEIEAMRKDRSWVGPTSAEVAEKVTNPVFGEAGAPTTRTGKVLQTAASMLPGMGETSFTRAVVAPTIGMEAGEEIGKRYGHETLGRLIGGFGGAVSPGGFTKGVTRNVDPERSAQVRTLMDEGVDLTAGQASGSKPLKYLETGPFEGKPAAINERQGQQFSQAALQRAGITADRASPDVMLAEQENFGRQYDDLIARSGGAALDSPLETELLQTVDDFHRLKSLPQNAPTAVNGYFKRISDAARDNGGVIPPDVFKAVRSDIVRDLKNSKDPEVRQALGHLQDSMFDSIGRNGPPGIREQWRDVNNNYRNFKTIEKAMGGAGEDTSRGLITPGKLRTAVESGDRTGYVQGRGDFADLARAAEGTMKPLPQSGTAARAAPIAIGSALAAGAGQLMSGNAMAGLGLLGGAAFQPLASTILTSRPVRTAIVREAAGRPLPLLDPITAALIARQEGR